MSERSPSDKDESGSLLLPVIASVAVIALLGYMYRDVMPSVNINAVGVGQESPSADNLTRGDYLAALDHASMISLRDSTPREEVIPHVINGINYVWPAGRPHRSDYKIAIPCEVDTNIATDADNTTATDKHRCHGNIATTDNPGDNWAMDLMYLDTDTTGVDDAMAGEPVRAITDGQILDVYQDTHYGPHCSAIQLSSIDGHIYYYGHLSDNFMVTSGQAVAAGQQIAEVGLDYCTPHHEAGEGLAHLHIDRGRSNQTEGQLRGGEDQNRDPDFIPIITELFANLPN